MNKTLEQDADLSVLRSQHATLSQEIRKLSHCPAVDYLELHTLKQRRLQLKDKIVARGGVTKKSK